METTQACTCQSVRHAAQTLTEFYDRLLAPSGLKITQYILLRAILSGEAAKSITALAEEVGIDRTTTGKNLRLLERDGLVSLGAGNDRRAREVQATEQGRQAVALARPLWQQAQTTMVETLGQDQLDTLMALLSQIEAVRT